MDNIKIYGIFENESGVLLKAGDKGYNKNKREQVENPHTIVGFFDTMCGPYAILKTPNSDEYVGEPCSEVEKYEEFVYDSDEHEEKDCVIRLKDQGKEIEISIKGV